MFSARIPAFLAAASLGAVPSFPAPPPPAAAAVHAETVTLDQFVTSATPFRRNQVELAQSTTVLSGRALALKLQPTVGETLAAETGMNATSFAPGASRPLIRGLGGDRIRLLENSVGTIDASVASPDHAVSIEPFLIERIEVVRGPASLLYGSAAVGGVVNVITHRIETEVPAERVRAGGEVRFGSGAGEWSRTGLLDLAIVHAPEQALILHLDGFRRDAGDLRIPGFAESSRLREAEEAEAAEHDEPVPAFARGRLPNSAVMSEGGAFGLSYVSKSLQMGASYSGLNSTYGVPAHAHDPEEFVEHAPAASEALESPHSAGVRIALRQRRSDFQAEFRPESGPVSALRFKLGVASYRHREHEPDGAVSTTFANDGHDARLEMLHGRDAHASGAVGLQFMRSDFAATGDEAFLPPSLTRSAAGFAFHEIVRDPVTWQLGARLEQMRLRSLNGATRNHRGFSGSFGAVWNVEENHTVALSLAHTSRAPTAQELFADGPHAGTQSFEIGNPELDPEKSLGIELSVRRRAGHVTGSLSVYANQFQGFIFEQPTGSTAIRQDDGWRFVEEAEGLPVFRYTQRDARFWGAELEGLWHLHESTRHQIDLRVTADLTRGRAGGENLPRIPARRLTAALLGAAGTWRGGIDGQFVSAQHRVAAAELSTEGYILLGAHLARSFSAGRWSWDVFARGTNLANREARPHTSVTKEFAPLPGRAVSLGIRLAY